MSQEQKKNKKEVRRIQVTGGSTYIISLPKKWVKDANLKKGSYVTVEPLENGRLIITPEVKYVENHSAEITIYISSNIDANKIIRRIISAYLAGYNIILIKSVGPNIASIQRNTIKRFIKQLLVGTEIIGETQNELYLKVLITYPVLVVQSVLKRMNLIASSMHTVAIEALKDVNKNLAHDILTMDDDVDRFNLYVIRQLKAGALNEMILHEIGMKTILDCFEYSVVSKSIERIADHAVKIAKSIQLMSAPPPTEIYNQIKKMSSLTIKIFNEAIDALLKRNMKKADQVIDQVTEVVSMEEHILNLLLKEKNSRDIGSYRIILESIRRTGEYVRDIAEIVIDLALDEQISKPGKSKITIS